MKILTALMLMIVSAGAYAQFGLGDIIKTETKKETAKDEGKAAAPAGTELPFAVKVGGQSAVAKADAAFATVEKPVSADAEIEVAADNPEMVIINAFPCDEKGTVKEGTAAAIILFQKTNKGKLDQTMDKKKLPAGTYIMNIVCGEKTARVLFKIK